MFCSLPRDAVGLSAVVIMFFPVYIHLLFAYLVSSYCNECFIHSPILNNVIMSILQCHNVHSS